MKTNINSALLSCPTERDFLEKTVSVLSTGVLAEGPLVGGLSFARNASIGPGFFSERSGSPIGPGEEPKLRKSINSALLSGPTGTTTVKYIISAPSKAILVEGPPVRRLLLAINASVGPVIFLKVPGAKLGPGSVEG